LILNLEFDLLIINILYQIKPIQIELHYQKSKSENIDKLLIFYQIINRELFFTKHFNIAQNIFYLEINTLYSVDRLRINLLLIQILLILPHRFDFQSTIFLKEKVEKKGQGFKILVNVLRF